MLYSTASFASSRRTPDTRTGSSLRSYSGPGERTDVPSQAARVTAFLIIFLLTANKTRVTGYCRQHTVSSRLAPRRVWGDVASQKRNPDTSERTRRDGVRK
ncbi:hypothetical protein HETIRDRAFT_438872 [Heterobasidion irregulare TC 32-1]|uniref:Uncharacterized protein n=1 Tax=Heterobasidion irregulare (strain TC 32-1) TaxID=747525 RepID=W4KDD9_HETIT|nr:uncharacterized protein HETIRDRAFT_438872 [Heterobasidion irregulare TC 32-1]ETW83867.1 hypothetical protein HETIRDRAFT_438872 [Heterobasidion irregulare TC 32-1]